MKRKKRMMKKVWNFTSFSAKVKFFYDFSLETWGEAERRRDRDVSRRKSQYVRTGLLPPFPAGFLYTIFPLLFHDFFPWRQEKSPFLKGLKEAFLRYFGERESFGVDFAGEQDIISGKPIRERRKEDRKNPSGTLSGADAVFFFLSPREEWGRGVFFGQFGQDDCAEGPMKRNTACFAFLEELFFHFIIHQDFGSQDVID